MAMPNVTGNNIIVADARVSGAEKLKKALSSISARILSGENTPT